jgi:hypothetical protein
VTVIVEAVAAITGVIVIIGVAEFTFRPLRRRYRLRWPCHAWFIIPASNQGNIDYAEQNESEHYIENLILPPHSHIEIGILYISSIPFTAAEIYFGCEEQDNRAISTKPLVEGFHNRFVEQGNRIRQETPDSHPDSNYIDHHKYYHIRRARNVARKEPYTLGFKVQTREPGTYKAILYLVGEEVGRPRNALSIIVQDGPVCTMKCVHPGHRRNGCQVSTKFQRAER